MYVQAVLIFLESQQEAVRYFYDHADEVNGITGLVLHIIKPREPRAGWEVNQVINSPRFPGLQFQDIPCLWVEATGGHFPVRLPGDVQAVQAVLFRLLDSFKDAKTFAEGERAFRAADAKKGLPQRPATQVVVTMHGFRTRAKWQKDFGLTVDEAKAGLQDAAFDYDWVGPLGLVNPFSRRDKVEWFREEYERLLQRKPELHDWPPSIIAHSYGSYIVARAMEKYPQIKFHRIIFCGSIVNRDYGWSARVKNGQSKRILNDYSRLDVWTRVAGWVIVDGGNAGSEGFTDTAGGAAVQRENRYWRHSDYFHDLNYRNRWIPFLAERGDPDEVAQEAERNRNLRFYVFVVALVVIAAAALWAVRAGWRHFMP